MYAFRVLIHHGLSYEDYVVLGNEDYDRVIRNKILNKYPELKNYPSNIDIHRMGKVKKL